MKITPERLRKIIKEELEAVTNEEIINRGNFKGFDEKTASKLQLLYNLASLLRKAAKTSEVYLPTKPNRYQKKSDENFTAYKAMIDTFDEESLKNIFDQINELHKLMRNAGDTYVSELFKFNSKQNLDNAEET